MEIRQWKVYGYRGGELGEAKNESFSFRHQRYYNDPKKTYRQSPVMVTVFNSDITGTTEYAIVRVMGLDKDVCLDEFRAQISDGVFEGFKVGKKEEIKVGEMK